MFVLFNLSTYRAGCDVHEVYEFPDGTSEQEINDYGDNLAYDNAEMHGVFDEAREDCEESGLEFDEGEYYSSSYEVLNMTREEIEEEYGEVVRA